MKISKLSLFYVSQFFAYSYFWLAIAVPYLLYRGLSPAQTFSLMSIYQIFGVILEYPTGVIGDKFGYRKVTFFANTFNCLAMLIMALKGNFYLYLFALLLLAIGSGLYSGNDMGVLKSISTNLKKDTANYNSLASLVLFLGSLIGGLVGKISLELALVISGLLMFSANIPLYFLPNKSKKTSDIIPIKQIISLSISAFQSKYLREIFVIAAILGGYVFCVKSIIGGFVDLYQLDVEVIGILIGLGALAYAIGSKLYAEKPLVSVFPIILTLVTSLIIISLSSSLYIVIGLVIFNQLLLSYVLSKIDGDMNVFANDQIRASIFSLKRLTMRFVAALYLLIYGAAIGANHFGLVTFGAGVMIALGCVFSWRYVNGITFKKTPVLI